MTNIDSNELSDVELAAVSGGDYTISQQAKNVVATAVVATAIAAPGLGVAAIYGAGLGFWATQFTGSGRDK